MHDNGQGFQTHYRATSRLRSASAGSVWRDPIKAMQTKATETRIVNQLLANALTLQSLTHPPPPSN
jgi:hypothetical protein